VICGGEDEEFSSAEARDALTPAKTLSLQCKLARLFPEVDSRAAFAWWGSFGSGKHGMPTFGAVPGYSRCYVVMGYGGNGITFSMLAAQMITVAISGKRLPAAPLFGFS
jgi:glycine/D-amino acid oxidase-like deaminating enzyme